METPTPEQIRAASPLLKLRYPESGDPANAESLEALLPVTAAIVASLTFRLIDPVTESTVEGYRFQPVPAGLIPVAVRAIALMMERVVVTGDPEFAEQLAQGKLIRSFSAGPYSESYFAPGEFSRRGASGRPAMDADEQLDAALWALATVEAREYFIATQTGIQPPAAGVQSFNYKRGRGNYDDPLTSWRNLGGPGVPWR